MALQITALLVELSMIILNSVMLANRKLLFINYWPFHALNISCFCSIVIGFTILYVRWKTIVFGTLFFIASEMLLTGYITFIMV